MKQITSVKFTFTNVCKIIPEKQKNCFLVFLSKKLMIYRIERPMITI